MSAICPLGGGLSPGYAFVVKSRPPSKAQSKGIDETRSSQNLEGGGRLRDWALGVAKWRMALMAAVA